MNLKRLLALLFFGAALLWLFFSPPNGNRKIAINRLVDQDSLNHLSPSEQQKITKLIAFFVQNLNLQEEACLNCRFDEQTKLRFFICTPAQQKITLCTEGNAVYDAALNAIFVDQSLASHRQWVSKRTFGEQATLAFLDVYLQFVILHELGHYVLHRSKGAVFDVFGADQNRKLQQYESEADAFAVEKFFSLLEKDSSGLLFNHTILENLAMDSTAVLTAVDKAMLCLSLMGRNINLAMLFGVSPYSEFFRDAAHSPFFTRCRGFITAALKRVTTPNEYYAKAEFIKLGLDEIATIELNNPFVEVKLTEPIANITFDNRGLLVQSLDSNVFRATLNDITPHRTGKSREHTLMKSGTNKKFFELARTFSLKPDAIFTISDSNFFRLNKDVWIQFPFGLDKRRIQQIADIVPQIQPADSIVYLHQFDMSYVVNAQQVLHEIPHGRVEEQLKTLLGSPTLYGLWDHVLIVENAAYLTIVDFRQGHQRLVGVASLDLLTSAVTQVTRFQTAGPELEGVVNDFDPYKHRLLYNTQKASFFLLCSRAPGRNRFEIWELSATEKPILLAYRAFNFSKMHSPSLLEIDPKIYPRSVAHYAKETYICNWDDDLIFLLNLNKGIIHPIFQFGASTVEIKVASNGLVAIFSPLTYRFYITGPYLKAIDLH